MDAPLRVLIVEDSPTAAALIAQILESDGTAEVVGIAVNGREGVEKALALRPDVVTMDIEMPVMDGIEATRRIMEQMPMPVVIVSSSTLLQETRNAVSALQAGALTLVAKPHGPGSPEFLKASRQLVEMVHIMSRVEVSGRARERASAVAPAPPTGARARRAGVVAVLASTGGPPALHALLAELPEDYPAPVVVVQHLAEGFMPGLVASLDAGRGPRVKLASHGEPLLPGTVYVGPDNRHLLVNERREVSLSNAARVKGFRPSGDLLFESVAGAYGRLATAVILTGMGSDGVAGLHVIRRVEGFVYAQSADTCIVNGMPGAAVAAGVVDRILSPVEIGREIARAVRLGAVGT